MSEMVFTRLSCIAFRDDASCPISSLEETTIFSVRSPWAIVSATRQARATGTVIVRVISQEKSAPIATVMAPATNMAHCARSWSSCSTS
ncbi:hypothetical protein D9M69_652370 [compost metagenome]